jgi:transcription factor STE12
MAHMMYSQHHATMAPPQKPETFMLSSEAQQSLPQDAQVALQQVDNCKYPAKSTSMARPPLETKKKD